MQASAAMRSMLGMQNVLNGVSMAGLRYNVGSMIRFTLNGNNYEFAGADDTPLVWVICDSAELTGTKYGCGTGQCGTYSRIRKAIHRASELSRKGPEDE
jgi:aerobic-type carbon monoxide dehydrogenase small subunit (CoxS/CutS family)